MQTMKVIFRREQNYILPKVEILSYFFFHTFISKSLLSTEVLLPFLLQAVIRIKDSARIH